MIEGEEETNSFAEFEATHMAPDDGAKDGEEAKPDDAGDKKPDDELALTEDDKVQDGETDDEAEDRHKTRSRPAHQRIAELTARQRAAERERDDALARLANIEKGTAEDATGKTPERPNPADFEFGDADPAFIDALTDWKVDTRLAERDAKAKKDREQAEASQSLKQLDDAWAGKAEKAVEKYPDFNEVVVESAAAKEWPLLPLSATAVAESEVGEDIAYHLATNRDDATRLAHLEQQFHATRQAALDAGVKPELANLFAKPYLDQANEMFSGLEAKFKDGGADRKPVKQVTDAPEPFKERTRGGGGQFDVRGDTPDFAAFERAAMRRRK